MALTTFPAIDPSLGTGKNIKFAIKKAQFGDGYSQRSSRGINDEVAIWTMQFTNINNTDADTIEVFVQARGGTEAFLWTPPFESVERQWTFDAESYDRKPNLVNSSNISFLIEENFDL